MTQERCVEINLGQQRGVDGVLERIYFNEKEKKREEETERK
jgi:hypothetical protein